MKKEVLLLAMKKDGIRQTRGILRSLARLLGDVKVARKGPNAVGKRVARRAAGKAAAKMLRKLFK